MNDDDYCWYGESMIETQPRDRPVPGWLTMLVLLLCLGGAGTVTYYVFRRPPPAAPFVEELPPYQGPPRRPQDAGGWGPIAGIRPTAPDIDGVSPINGGKNGYRIKAQSLVIHGYDPRKSGAGAGNVPVPFAFSFTPLWSELLTPDQRELRTAALDISSRRNATVAAQADLRQVEQLREAAPTFVADTADQDRLGALLNAYVQASASDKLAAERALVAVAKGIAGKYIPALKQQAIAGCARVTQILRPEQLAAYREWNRTGLSTVHPPTTAR